MRIAIILAGGIGRRLNLGRNKVFTEIAGRPIICHTIENFEKADSVSQIIIAAGNHSDGTADDDISSIENLVKESDYQKVIHVVAGGETRMKSVQNALNYLDLNDQDLVLIQDGARPFTSPELIDELIQSAENHGAAIPAVPPKDSIQTIDQSGFVTDALKRNQIVAIQTPVVAKWYLIREAREKAAVEGYLDYEGYEDSALLQKNGVKVKLVESTYENLKITTKEDLLLAEQIAAEK